MTVQTKTKQTKTNSSKPAARFGFRDFKQWRQVFELLLASNALGLILAVASVARLSDITWTLLIHHVLFVSWVCVAFAYCIDYLQGRMPYLARKTFYIFSFLVLILIVLFSGFIINILQHHAQFPRHALTWQIISEHSLRRMVLGGGIGLIVLRYLYVRELWIEQRQSELMARVQALQARIHPHFLFNSLNSVVSLIGSDPFKAEQMLIDLSSLFRASLTELREVSLAEEVELCQRYLKIEGVRLGDRLQVKWRIDGENMLNQAKIPLLTLQPLLENCIYHGVESLSKVSMVSILIEIRDHHVSIVLTNPYQTKVGQTKSESNQGNGIAIDNVKQRLMAYYGAEVKFSTFARDDVYTTLLSYRYS